MHSGATDGYFGHWVPDSGYFKGPIKTNDTGATLIMSRTQTGWIWACQRCATEIRTETYTRPTHLCLDKSIDP